MTKELRELGVQLRASQEENQSLRRQLRRVLDDRDAELGFQTPDEHRRSENAPEPQPATTSRTTTSGKGVGGQASAGAQAAPGGGDKTMEFMAIMLQSMQAMQKNYMDEKSKGTPEVEVVRSNAGEFPMLPEWDAIEAPLKMGDWLAMLEPLVSDLSDSSEEFWRLMIDEVGKWYRDHMSLSPLDRASHSFEAPGILAQRRWQRLEKRVAGMLIKSVPDGVREDLVSNKRLGTFAILAALQVIYQPGGLGEKRALLKALEDPMEAAPQRQFCT